MPEYGQYDVPTSDIMVNLGVGQPDNRKLPLDLIKKAMKQFIEKEDNKEVLQYGDIPGYKRFRKKLADWLSDNYYGDELNTTDNIINEDELFICNGITHALHLIMTVYMYQDDTILVEDPSYFIMINIFKDFGLDVEAISMEEDGIDMDELEEKLESLCKTQERVFLYTIPINHNPTGITMANHKRNKLSELCDTYNNFYVLADEVYHFLSWESDGERYKPLADYHPNIITIGSFSKILAPSMRLGWIYQNSKFEMEDSYESVINSLCKSGIYDSTGGTGVLSSYITECLIDSGDLDKYIQICKDFLGSRCKTICDTLAPLKEKNLINFIEPKGGYFVWVELQNIEADDLLEECIKNKVKFHPGWKFTSIKNGFSDCIRLSVSYYDETDLKIGITRLNNVIENFNKTKISILGSTGKLGSLILEEISKNDNYIFNKSIDRNMDLSFISNNNNLIIDVSRPEATNNLLDKLIEDNFKVPLIIGTTGDIDSEKIETYSKQAAVLKISNFSDGIPTILEFSEFLNKLPDDWKFKMIEKHHVNKQDSPSGTAISWTDKLKKSCQIESVREGEIFGEHKLIISNENEEIVIHHTAKNRNIFASGCLKYINWIVNKEPGFYENVDFDELKYPRIRKYSASGNILIVAEFVKESKWQDFVYQESNKDSKLDGVIFIKRFQDENSKEMKTEWNYYNRDGTQVDFCGNGVRCIGKYLEENYKELTGSLINTKDTVSIYKVHNNNIYFDSPNPFLIKSKVAVDKILSLIEQFEFLNISDINLIVVGVPHIVIECECDIFEVDDSVITYLSETIMNANKNFNINYISLTDDSNFKIRTYERGVNRETGSCGSGTLASYFYLYTNKKVSINCQAHYKNNDSMYVYTKDDGLNKFYLGGLVNTLSK